MRLISPGSIGSSRVSSSSLCGPSPSKRGSVLLEGPRLCLHGCPARSTVFDAPTNLLWVLRISLIRRSRRRTSTGYCVSRPPFLLQPHLTFESPRHRSTQNEPRPSTRRPLEPSVGPWNPDSGFNPPLGHSEPWVRRAGEVPETLFPPGLGGKGRVRRTSVGPSCPRCPAGGSFPPSPSVAL